MEEKTFSFHPSHPSSIPAQNSRDVHMPDPTPAPVPTAHRHTHRVRYRECDPMGVVYHAHYLDYFEAARTEALRAWGLPYKALEDAGVQMPVVEAEPALPPPGPLRRPAGHRRRLS